jgi:putative intracellular protease/amidase
VGSAGRCRGDLRLQGRTLVVLTLIAMVRSQIWISGDGAATPEIILIPGGQGARRLVKDEAFLSWLREWATRAPVVTSVCTTSAVLTAAGLLDGYRPTSNKAAFA